MSKGTSVYKAFSTKEYGFFLHKDQTILYQRTSPENNLLQTFKRVKVRDPDMPIMRKCRKEQVEGHADPRYHNHTLHKAINDKGDIQGYIFVPPGKSVYQDEHCMYFIKKE